MSKPPRPAALRYRTKSALIATAYAIVLVVPWILTCVLSSRTVRQSWDNSGAVGRQTARDLHRVAFLIDALNLIATVVALPVIYALLARAAVVFSQRTNNRKTLSVKEFIALADRKFVRSGFTGNFGAKAVLLLGTALVLLAVVLPPIRAILVYSETKLFPETYPYASVKRHKLNGWVGEPVGADPLILDVGTVPRNLVVEKTRHALIDAFPPEWTATAWYDPDAERNYGTDYPGRYFASSLPRHTTTGMYKQHALRMNSSSRCDDIPVSEVPVPCPGTYDHVFHTSYDNANLTVHICVPQVPGGISARWNNTENRQELTETLYVTMSSPGRDATLRCIGKTSMGYFELGNSFNGGKFGPLLSGFKFPTATRNPGEFSDDVRYAVYPDLGSFSPRRMGEPAVLRDYGTVTDVEGHLGAYGPLALASHAMFGAGSFFERAQFIREPNDTLSQTLCQLSPIPFSRTELYLSRCDPQDTRSGSRGGSVRGRFASRYGWANDRVEALILGIRASNGSVTGLLNTAMYLANKATLEVAVGLASVSRRGLWDPRQIWRADGIEIRTPVVSTTALVVVTVLLSLQVVGILVLVSYIYSVPTWTETLDAMAVARITRQLAERDGGFLRSDGLWKPTAEEVGQMEDMDALVGLIEHEVSDEVTLAPGASENADHVLSVGAPGLIYRGMKKVSKSSL